MKRAFCGLLVVCAAFCVAACVGEEAPEVAGESQALDGRRQDRDVVTTGTNHSCAILRDARVACWGNNASGQVGDGTSIDRLTPVTLTGLTGVVSLAAGDNHTCALRYNGTVWCWGLNTYGQLGDGSTLTRNVPTEVAGLQWVTALAAGNAHTCARGGNGGLRCWGYNVHGQVGDGTTTNRLVPTEIDLPKVNAIAAGGNFTCAISDEWWTYCWGYNGFGQLGDGTTTHRHEPTILLAGPFRPTGLTAGERHACALTGDGTVACWGSNANGQLGDGTYSDHLTPVIATNLPSATQVVAGYDHTCARRGTGRLACWGNNASGQLGTGASSPTPTTVPTITGVSHVAVDGSSLRSHTCARTGDGAIWCWGGNAEGQIGTGTRTEQPTPFELAMLDAATPGIATGGVGTRQHSCGLVAGGRVACWGAGNAGQLGDGNLLDRTTPVIVRTSAGAPLESVIAVVVGDEFSCALRSTGYAYCWGGNTVGELGSPGAASAYARQVAGGNRITALTAGSRHACALYDDGTARCWGSNQDGALGDGTETNSATPVLVDDLDDAVSISAGALHTCAVRTYGHVVCWGNLVYGQWGIVVPTSPFGTRPIVTGIADAVEVSAGNWHSCALMSNGQVKCWGNNDFGQLGDDSTGTDTTAVVAQLPYPAVQVTVGAEHACALLVNGTVRCWGLNTYGQLGDGTTVDRDVPVHAESNMVTIDAGGRQTCGVRTDGTARCWGDNEWGQLGDATNVDAPNGTNVVSFP